MRVTYIINLGVEAQKNAAAVNRTKAFVKGLKYHGVESEILFPYSKIYKYSLQGKIIALYNIVKHL